MPQGNWKTECVQGLQVTSNFILTDLCPSFLLCVTVDIFYLRILFFCTGDPHNDPNAQGDAFKTLFVARVVSPQLPSPGAPEKPKPWAAESLGVGQRTVG